MHESVDLTPLPGPRGLAEASDEIDRNSEVAMNFPARAQDSTALEPLQGEMIDNFHGDAVARSPEGLSAREMRQAGLTSETIWEKVAARHKRARNSRLASLQMPPYYHVGGERAEPSRGRKRAFEAGNEPSSRSSSSSASSRSSGSRASQLYRSSLICPGDGGESARRTAGGELAVPARAGDRGGGAAPAQRHNLSPAHGNSANAYQGLEEAPNEGASGEHAAAGGPAEPAFSESDQARYLFKNNPQLWLIQSLLKQLSPEDIWAQLTEQPHSPTSRG
jgi:hypothetical protein